MTHDVTPELLKQIADQCAAVHHLANSLARVHRDYERIYRDPACAEAAADIAEIVGSRTADIMETLGDILNGMDAADESDEWLEPVFREAQRLWPVNRDPRVKRQLEEAARPFADAAENIDEPDGDHEHIWEHPAAMNITKGDLRRIRALLDRDPKSNEVGE